MWSIAPMFSDTSTKMNKSDIHILIACEESQAIANAFRERGFEAYSCDLKPCSGGHKEYHINDSCLPLINGKDFNFKTEDGVSHNVKKWDLIIAHPPCTYLTTSGNRWFNVEKYGDAAIKRINDRKEAMLFFMLFAKSDCERVAIENPIGIMNTAYRKPNQIIQPYMWGDNTVKSTCLWLKGLPNLVPDITEKPEIKYKEWIDKNGKKKRQAIDSYSPVTRGTDRQTKRSKTFNGIANAIADQWGKYLEDILF